MRFRFLSVLLIACLCVLSIVFAFPFYWIVVSGLKTPLQTWASPPAWVPRPIYFKNITDLFAVKEVFPFFRYLWNTVYVATLGGIGTVISSSLAAYAFARLRWKGSGFFFVFSISTIMLPYATYLIPRYIIFKNIGILGTFMPMWLPPALGTAFNIFLFTQFFRGIPSELSDAAIVDGCNHFGIFFRIILPLSGNVIITVFMLHFVGAWQDLLTPLVYFTNKDMYTLSVGLKILIGFGTGAQPVGVVMAAAFIVCIPLLIIFGIFQKYLIRGVSLSGIKM